jgi:hypothetical protein
MLIKDLAQEQLERAFQYLELFLFYCNFYQKVYLARCVFSSKEGHIVCCCYRRRSIVASSLSIIHSFSQSVSQLYAGRFNGRQGCY